MYIIMNRILSAAVHSNQPALQLTTLRLVSDAPSLRLQAGSTVYALDLAMALRFLCVSADRRLHTRGMRFTKMPVRLECANGLPLAP